MPEGEENTGPDCQFGRTFARGHRVIDFANEPAHLSVKNDQLVIRRDGSPDVTTPISELAACLLSSRTVTCTVPLLDRMMQFGTAVIVCDEQHHPSGMMLPLAGHFQQARRMIAQATASQPLKKRIWRDIVIAKVQSQAANLMLLRGTDGGLDALAAAVRAGDPMNVEAHAAQRYWPLLMADPMFRRRRDAPDANRLLNYGYAIVRAAVGRAIVATGLHPSLGVHHHSRENPFCLADDLMEPYRALVDAEVVEIVGEHGADVALTPMIKQRLVGVIHDRLSHGTSSAIESRTALEWISRSAASLGRLLGDRGLEGAGKGARIFFPDGLLKP